MNAAVLAPVSVLAHTLINELDRIEPPFILVLDDYHFMREASINDLLTEILNQPPQSLHLVVVTRHDPPLPLFRYRSGGRMTEIGVRDLCFSMAETRVFLQNFPVISADDAMVAELYKKTEGWVTGLRLAVLAMRQASDALDILLEPQTDVNFVMEYLFNEVFKKKPPEFRQYLLSSAIPDRLCGPLCQAMCMAGPDPEACELNGWKFILVKPQKSATSLLGEQTSTAWQDWRWRIRPGNRRITPPQHWSVFLHISIL